MGLGVLAISDKILTFFLVKTFLGKYGFSQWLRQMASTTPSVSAFLAIYIFFWGFLYYREGIMFLFLGLGQTGSWVLTKDDSDSEREWDKVKLFHGFSG